MGIDNSKFKKNNRTKSEIGKFPRKNSKKKRSSEKLNDNIFDNLAKEMNQDNNIYKSKTLKNQNLNKNLQIDNINDLKSLSDQNLMKIDDKNNFDEGFRDSVETNCDSSKSKEEEYKKMLTEELYDDLEDNNSFDEDDDVFDENDESDEDEEEKKKKELMITNNIKAVFIDSKANPKEHNENENDDNIVKNRTSSSSSITAYDYELNFYRNGNDIRQSYLTKLISSKVWTPNMKPKQHNSIIIFDWDDTLLPTSFLTPGGIFIEDLKISAEDKEKIQQLEQTTLKLLTEAVEKGNVYIITNAGKGWVEFSANKFYPSIMPILEKIKIISARGEYEKIFPGNSRQWKIEAFLNLQKSLNMKLVTNIICLGDSLFEIEAGRILASRFTEAFIKTIKFREAPKLDELLKQLNLVCSQFSTIYSSIKNLTIRVEKKK